MVKSDKLAKITAWILLIVMYTAFLIALSFGIYKKYWVPEINWSNLKVSSYINERR